MKIQVLTVVFVLALGVYIAWPKINTDDAIDAIVGEASNQSYDTMICVGQAIRHRGTLRGVYGLHAPHNYSENADVWEQAEESWADSAIVKDMVHGSKNWASQADLNYYSRRGKVVKVKAVCGELYFY